MNIVKIASFEYNGVARKVQIEKETATYIQGENLEICGVQPERPFSTFSKSKMRKLSIETFQRVVSPNKAREIADSIVAALRAKGQ